MKNFLSRGCLGLIIGIILGAIIGVIVHFINWYALEIGLSSITKSDSNFMVLTLIFALVGAILIGIFGIIIGSAIAAMKKPES